MNRPMRIFQRENGVYYVELGRGRKKSLNTKDHAKAIALFREMEKEWLRGRLVHLENEKRISLGEFAEPENGRTNLTAGEYDR